MTLENTGGTSGAVISAEKDVGIQGEAKITPSNNNAYLIRAYKGDIALGKGMDVTNLHGTGLSAKGNITVNGSVTGKTYWAALISEDGSIQVTGDVTLENTGGTSGAVISAGKDVGIQGNVTIPSSASSHTSYGIYAPNGKVIMTSGVWDITAGNYAIYAKNGIEIPSTHEVTLPDGGEINQVTVDDNTFYTVTEADGSTVAAHAVIELKAVTYTVSFAANGGTGTMADVTGISGEYTLPENGFTAPDGKQFKAWSVGGVEKAAGDTITVNANTTVTAIWEDIPAGHTHSYGSEWKSDADKHWHECSCGDKDDVAAHSFKWVVDKEATATKKGSKHEECKFCGYQRPAVEIPATGSTTKPTNPTESNPNTGALDDVPKTGDNSNMILWIVLLLASGLGVTGTVVYSKRKKYVK